MVQKNLHWSYLGLAPYAEVFKLQESIRDELLSNPSPGQLLLTQHPPTITLGRGEKGAGLRMDPPSLARDGYDVVESNRGGKVTYHGPGQLVAYPIVNLGFFQMGVKEYVHALEEVMIRFLSEFSLSSHRKCEYPGAWIQNKKIGSIGIHVKKQVSIHGLALNITTDLGRFSAITPCGIDGVQMTSLQDCGVRFSVEQAIPLFLQVFEDVFRCRLIAHAKTSQMKEISSARV